MMVIFLDDTMYDYYLYSFKLSEHYEISVIIVDLKKMLLFTSLSLMAAHDFT